MDGLGHKGSKPSVTAWRTGLAAALATHTLAAPAATALGFIGTGAQARTTLIGLRHLRQWNRISATDLDSQRAAEFTATVAPQSSSAPAASSSTTSTCPSPAAQWAAPGSAFHLDR